MISDSRTTPAPPAPSLTAIRRELALTGLLLADNAVASFLPGLLFAAAACAHRGITGPGLVRSLAVGIPLFALYHYVFDTSNQATGAEEDKGNKTYRPVPRGLTTPRGLLVRFWCAMPLYTLLGWLTGTLGWVLLWQAVVVGLNLLARPRDYLWVKPVAMILGTVAQLAAAWQLVTPLDATGWRWVLVVAVAFNLPLRFEDIRDMKGDRLAGRPTLPLLIGHWPVRIWFAAVMAVLPLAMYALLFAPARAGAAATVGCALAVAAMSWTASARSLLLRDVPADRITYQLYCVTYAVTLACGAVLL